ncbi:MAG TPA: NADH-quinone oxidoreductase subunit NuoK [Candidatus Deferrimicrobium sp.]|nr:NADH-quinone oxidoreductase subunit NuoK [Candidatus Deferrimicrobium sp.]
MIPVTHCLILSAILFSLGVLGVFVRRNAIVVFMCIEMMLNAVNLTFIAFAQQNQALDGQVMVLFVMTVAAAEAAIGLAIVLALYRNRKTLNVDEINLLKG